MEVSDWALVGATIGLVVATLVLAWFTWGLYRITKRLKEIEDRRDRKEGLLRRWSRVGRKLELAGQMIHMTSEALLKPLVIGSVSQGNVAIFQKLHHHLDFGYDQVVEADVDKLLLAFDGANRGAKYSDAVEDLEPVLKRIQDRLSGDLFKWRKQLVELSSELFISEDDLQDLD